MALPPAPPVSTKPHPPRVGIEKLKSLAYSQIDTFLTRPLKYKYRYVLKVPAAPHHMLTFGETIHRTLLDFHRLKRYGKPVSAHDLVSLYKKHFIDA